MRFTTKNLVVLALLSAIAAAVTFVFNLSLIPAAPFLTYDPKDVFIVLGGFLFGPLAVILMSATVSFIEMLIISKDGFIGMAANMLSTCTFACTAVLIYRTRKNVLSAAIGLTIGCVASTCVMLLWNFLIVPLYMQIPDMTIEQTREHVKNNMLIPVFLPFNLIKGGINAVLLIIVYKPLMLVFAKAKLN
ncbi:MAG: ECF transporter S component [Oscillospiraceae bacterium]|nr:ECF transporter S component [Oscillospiraceae bacterium]